MLLSMTSVRQNAIMRRTRNLPYKELSDTQKCELQSQRVVEAVKGDNASETLHLQSLPLVPQRPAEGVAVEAARGRFGGRASAAA